MIRNAVGYQIRYYGRVSSTQDIAKRLVASESVRTVIVADEQERGRGRFGNTWVSPKGGLYASLILNQTSLLPFRVGIAVAEALRNFEIEAMLKWPNDVLVDEKKIAGILIENVEERAIVGIGINLATSPLKTATSVSQETSMKVSRDDLLELILRRFGSTPSELVLTRYRALCTTLGQVVRAEFGGAVANRTIIGRAVGIDAAGRLLVAVDETLHAIASGECIHLQIPLQEEQQHPN